MVAASWHISWLLFFHILVIYLVGNVTKMALVGSHFPLLSPSVSSLSRSSFFFHLIHLYLSLLVFLSALTYVPSLIILSCVKLSVSRSPGNRLTFALGYCSHLLALKHLNIQNPTLHLRHWQISPATISHSCVYDHVFCIHECCYLFFHKPGAGHMWHWANIQYDACAS